MCAGGGHAALEGDGVVRLKGAMGLGEVVWCIDDAYGDFVVFFVSLRPSIPGGMGSVGSVLGRNG